MSADVEESALLLRCPAAEPAVGAWRARLDLAAGVGVPAHVTVTYPFRPVAALADADHGRLERLFAATPSFTLVGERTAWFDDEVLYVELTGAERVSALTEAVARRVPRAPSLRRGVRRGGPPPDGRRRPRRVRAARRRRCRARAPAVPPGGHRGRAVERAATGDRRRALAPRAGLPPGLNRGVDQDASRLRGARRGIRVGVERAAGQAAVEQEGERAGQPARVGRPGIRGQAGDPLEHRGLVRDRAVVHRGARHRLGGRVDEGAAAVAVAAAGGAQRVEEADQLVGRVGAGGLGGVVQLPAPDAVDLVEVGDDEVVLGRELLVEGRLGHARLGDDPVDADRPDAAGVEEPERGVEDAVAGGGGGHGLIVDRSVC